MSEREFQRKVIDTAHTFGWRVAHFRTAMNARGHYQTPVGADGAGWPDLVLVHPDRGLVLYRELKAGRGRLSPAQEDWQVWLAGARADVGVWRESDWPAIVAELSCGRAVSVA